MRLRISLYILLLVALLAQVTLIKYIVWFPDLVLLLVIFTGIFCGRTTAACFGLISGLLRGCFSPETLILDIFLFLFIGIMSSLFTVKLYKQSIAAQMLIVMFAGFFVLVSQTIYLNIVTSNEIEVFFILLESWRYFISTICAAPLLFSSLKWVLRIKE